MRQSGSMRYILELVESHNSRNRKYRGSLVGHGRGRGPQHLAELTILWLASTVMGEIGAHNRGRWHAPCFLLSTKVFYFRQIAYFRLTIHTFTHLPSPDTALTGFAVVSIEYSLCNIRQFRNLPISNPRIYSLAIAPHCVLQGMPLTASSTLCAILFSLLTPESVFLSNLLSSP